MRNESSTIWLPLLLTAFTFQLGAQSGPSPLKSFSASTNASREESLRKQLASVEAFRTRIEAGSLASQQKSVARQYASVRKVPNSVQPLDRSQTTEATSSEPVAPQANEVSFFHSPWPASTPLSVPNVQVVGDSCDALKMDEVEKLVSDAGKKHGGGQRAAEICDETGVSLQAVRLVCCRSHGPDADHAGDGPNASTG